jgi:hypothetical protein
VYVKKEKISIFRVVTLVFQEKLKCRNIFDASLNKNFIMADGNISGYNPYLFYAGGGKKIYIYRERER